MRNLHKIANIALIFMLIGAFLCQEAYCLRVPVQSETLNRIGAAQNEEAQTEPLVSKELCEIPKEVISIVHQFKSFEQFENWLDDVLSVVTLRGKLDKEALSYLEILTLLFGLESKPDKGLVDSKGSIIKNMQVDEKDKERIYDVFYSSDVYEYNKEIAWEPDTMWETIEFRCYEALKDIMPAGNKINLLSRIKQYKSLLLKLGSIVSQIEGSDKKDISLSDSQVIDKILGYKSIIAADPMKYFDDMLGFNFIINDTGMDREERERVLTMYTDQVESALKAQFKDIKLTKVRKESRVPSFEAVNFSIQGWLNHKELGSLPIKIQFRFKNALNQESAMYYIYKKYGCWELPIWARNINFNNLESFRELQEILFDNFKNNTAELVPEKPFLIEGHFTLPEGGMSFAQLVLDQRLSSQATQASL